MYEKIIQSAIGSMGGQSNTKLPKWANGLIVIGSVAIVGAVGYFIFLKWKEKKKEEEGKVILDQQKTELDQQLQNGQKLSFPQSVYTQTASSIAQKMDGCETVNTELEVVEAICRIVKVKADWLALCQAFGTRDISDCGSLGLSKVNQTLPTLLTSELDTMLMMRRGYVAIFGITGFTLDINGVKKTFSSTDDTIDVLRYYLQQKGVTI